MSEQNVNATIKINADVSDLNKGLSSTAGFINDLLKDSKTFGNIIDSNAKIAMKGVSSQRQRKKLGQEMLKLADDEIKKLAEKGNEIYKQLRLDQMRLTENENNLKNLLRIQENINKEYATGGELFKNVSDQAHNLRETIKETKNEFIDNAKEIDKINQEIDKLVEKGLEQRKIDERKQEIEENLLALKIKAANMDNKQLSREETLVKLFEKRRKIRKDLASKTKIKEESNVGMSEAQKNVFRNRVDFAKEQAKAKNYIKSFQDQILNVEKNAITTGMIDYEEIDRLNAEIAKVEKDLSEFEIVPRLAINDSIDRLNAEIKDVEKLIQETKVKTAEDFMIPIELDIKQLEDQLKEMNLQEAAEGKLYHAGDEVERIKLKQRLHELVDNEVKLNKTLESSEKDLVSVTNFRNKLIDENVVLFRELEDINQKVNTSTVEQSKLRNIDIKDQIEQVKLIDEKIEASKKDREELASSIKEQVKLKTILKEAGAELKSLAKDGFDIAKKSANSYFDSLNPQKYRENKQALQELRAEMEAKNQKLRENKKELIELEKAEARLTESGRVRKGDSVTVAGKEFSGKNNNAGSALQRRKAEIKAESQEITMALEDQGVEAKKLGGTLNKTRMAYVAMAAGAVGALNYIKNATPQIGAQMTIVNHEFKMMAREIGKELVPMFKAFASVARDMRKWFKGQPQWVKKAIAVFFMLVAALVFLGTVTTATTVIMGGLATSMGGAAAAAVTTGIAMRSAAKSEVILAGRGATLSKVFLKLKTGVKVLGGFLAGLSAPVLVLIAVFVAAALIATKFKEVITGFSGAIDKGAKSSNGFVRVLSGFGKAIFFLLTPVFLLAAAIRFLVRMFTIGPKEAFEEFKENLRLMLEKSGKYMYDLFIAPIIYLWENKLKPVLETGASYFDQFDNNVSESIRKFMATIDKLIEKIVNFFNHTTLHDALETAKGYFTSFFTKIGDGFKNFWNRIKEFIDKIMDKLDFESKLDKMINTFKDKFNSIKDFFMGWGESISGFFSGLFDKIDLGELGAKLLTFIGDSGFADIYNGAIDSIVGTLEGIVDFFTRDDSAKEAEWLGKVQSLLNFKMGDISNAIGNSEAFGTNIPLATGTMMVPQDMNARIHKGEMVIPATFAQGIREMLSGSGGGPTSKITNSFNITVYESKDADEVAKKVTDQVMAEINRQVNWQ